MTTLLTNIVFGMAMSLVGQPQAADPLDAAVTQMVAKFDEAYRTCGEKLTFPATVEVLTHPSLVSYQFPDRIVRVSRYSELSPEIQNLMAAWAAAAAKEDGEALFSDIFNSLLVPHEMGHWMQHISGRALKLDRWEGEVEANRIAIAFWSLDATEAKALPGRIEGFVEFLGKLPNPVPEGQDARAYFNANYDTFDAVQYGWFQGAFMREAWARKSGSSFCDLARLNAAAPADAFANDPK